MTRLADAMAVVVGLLALLSVVIVFQTGDLASEASAATQIAIVIALLYARRQLLGGRAQRAVTVIVGSFCGVLGARRVSVDEPRLAGSRRCQNHRCQPR